MPAPLGNQYAVGNKGGRPGYDLEKEAEDILKWAENPDSTSIYMFTFNKKYLAEDLSEFANRNEVFREALKKAKEMVGINREKKCSAGTMNYGVWNRSAPLYDPLLKKFEKEVVEHKIDYELEKKAKMEAIKGVSPNDSGLNEIIKELRELNGKKSKDQENNAVD